MPHLVSIDRAHEQLTILGWSVGDMGYRLSNGTFVWQVTCRRDDHRIITRAQTQKLAWNAALKQAGIVQREVNQRGVS